MAVLRCEPADPFMRRRLGQHCGFETSARTRGRTSGRFATILVTLV
jgi:hypothetical protein